MNAPSEPKTPAPRRGGFVRAVGGMMAARAGGDVLRFVRTLAIAGALAEITYGDYQIIILLFFVAEFCTLSVEVIITRELPFLWGRGDHARAAQLRDSTLTLYAILSCVAFALMVAGVLASPLEGDVRLSYLLQAGAFFVGKGYMAHANMCRARMRFGAMARYEVARSIMENAAIVALVLRWGLPVVPGALLASNAVAFLVARRFQPLGFHWRFKEFKHVALTGLPFVAQNLAYHGQLQADRLVVLVVAGKVPLATYGFAVGMARTARTLLDQFGAVITPVYNRLSGSVAGPRGLLPLWRVVAWMLFSVATLFVGLGWCLLGVFFRVVAQVRAAYFSGTGMPLTEKFEGSLALMGILLAAHMWSVAAVASNQTLVSKHVGREWQVTRWNALAALFNLGLSWALLTHGAGLAGVALASVLANGGLWFGLALVSMRRMHVPASRAFSAICSPLQSLAPLVVLWAALSWRAGSATEFFMKGAPALDPPALGAFLAAWIAVVLLGYRLMDSESRQAARDIMRMGKAPAGESAGPTSEDGSPEA